jgi:twitching motility protein PilT
VTIEAPVEHLHANKKAMITQLEVGQNVSSIEHGIALALELDADVIVVGDASNATAARMVLSAAESGRRVMAVMTGLSAIQAITRLVTMVPPDEREIAVSQLATTLEGVVAQRLAKTRDGKLRPVVEILRGGLNVTKSILENRFKDLSYHIEGRQGGMQSLDQHLIELHQSGVISGTETMRLANNPEAVGMELRALRQTAPAPAPAGTNPLGADQGLLK